MPNPSTEYRQATDAVSASDDPQGGATMKYAMKRILQAQAVSQKPVKPRPPSIRPHVQMSSKPVQLKAEGPG